MPSLYQTLFLVPIMLIKCIFISAQVPQIHQGCFSRMQIPGPLTSYRHLQRSLGICIFIILESLTYQLVNINRYASAFDLGEICRESPSADADIWKMRGG